MTEKTMVENVRINRYSGELKPEVDLVVVEEPLEIRLVTQSNRSDSLFSLSVTMRTPGNDFELALGFLLTEGIIQSYSDVISMRYCESAGDSEKGNIVKVYLKEGIHVDEKKLSRNFYTNSSCGVCSKSSIDSIDFLRKGEKILSDFHPDSSELIQIPDKVLDMQHAFRHTGGIHAAALIDESYSVVMVREDVGRHNALDKLIGAAMAQNLLPLHNFLIFVSGRAGFELIQKAIIAGAGNFAAVGAPSNLAVNLSNQYNMRLFGFLRNGKFNNYHFKAEETVCKI